MREEKLKAFITGIVPVNFPKLWLSINGISALWSILLIWSIIVVDETPVDYLQDTRIYLIYNFATTILWCFEIGLTAWWKKHQNHQNYWDWTQQIELIIAIYFWFDSIHMLSKWLHPKEDVEGEIFDCFINSIAYIYESWVILYNIRRRDNEHDDDHPISNKNNNGNDYQSIV